MTETERRNLNRGIVDLLRTQNSSKLMQATLRDRKLQGARATGFEAGYRGILTRIARLVRYDKCEYAVQIIRAEKALFDAIGTTYNSGDDYQDGLHEGFAYVFVQLASYLDDND